MKKYLEEYLEYIAKILSEHDGSTDVTGLKAEFLVKIQFMQHERLVHFLVTMLVVLVLILSICTYILHGSIMLLPLILIVLGLTVAYIMHYYFLENSVQKMYELYDDICKWEEEKKNG